jgi:uncharacterized protein YukE
MAATGAYEINPSAVASVTSNVAGLASHTGSVVGDLASTVLDGVAFAQIGSAVAGANSTMQNQLVNVLGKVVQLLQTVNQNVQSSNTGYTSADTAVAQAFGGTQPAAATTTAATTTATTAATTGAATTATGLSPSVVDSIMASEGASGEQGGVPEAYGFRQNMHNGYDQIMAARNQYGQGSQQEHDVVAGLLNNEAQQAGALNFTDPGTQAAIMSAAHMRGVGGAQAILNSVAGDPIQRSGTLSPDTIQAVQGMTPDQFQQQFHDTRIQYDQTIYGNTTTHQAGQTDTWWHRYGNGLTNRYDSEQQQFLGLSNPTTGN